MLVVVNMLTLYTEGISLEGALVSSFYPMRVYDLRQCLLGWISLSGTLTQNRSKGETKPLWRLLASIYRHISKHGNGVLKMHLGQKLASRDRSPERLSP